MSKIWACALRFALTTPSPSSMPVWYLASELSTVVACPSPPINSTCSKYADLGHSMFVSENCFPTVEVKLLFLFLYLIYVYSFLCSFCFVLFCFVFSWYHLVPINSLWQSSIPEDHCCCINCRYWPVFPLASQWELPQDILWMWQMLKIEWSSYSPNLWAWL